MAEERREEIVMTSDEPQETMSTSLYELLKLRAGIILLNEPDKMHDTPKSLRLYPLSLPNKTKVNAVVSTIAVGPIVILRQCCIRPRSEMTWLKQDVQTSNMNSMSSPSNTSKKAIINSKPCIR